MNLPHLFSPTPSLPFLWGGVFFSFFVFFWSKRPPAQNSSLFPNSSPNLHNSFLPQHSQRPLPPEMKASPPPFLRRRSIPRNLLFSICRSFPSSTTQCFKKPPALEQRDPQELLLLVTRLPPSPFCSSSSLLGFAERRWFAFGKKRFSLERKKVLFPDKLFPSTHELKKR